MSRMMLCFFSQIVFSNRSSCAKEPACGVLLFCGTSFFPKHKLSHVDVGFVSNSFLAFRFFLGSRTEVWLNLGMIPNSGDLKEAVT